MEKRSRGSWHMATRQDSGDVQPHGLPAGAAEENAIHGGLSGLPAWHGDVLRETEQRYESGQELPIDWATAKRQLRECRK